MNNQINTNTVYVIAFENNWYVHENNKQMLTLNTSMLFTVELFLSFNFYI